MPVVVTGAAGFIGSQLAQRLLRGGHHVIGIDRRAALPDGVSAHIGDLAAPSRAIRTALRQADAVFHLAGCPGVRGGGPGVAARRLRDNVIAGQRVLDLTPHDVPLMVVSSSSVYGGARPGPNGWRPCHEDDPVAPRGGYAESKVQLERLCRRRAERGGNITVLRPFTVAGEGQRPDMALSIWIDAAARGLPLPILGSRDRQRDITDVRDVVEGLLRAWRFQPGGVINLGTGVGHRLGALADTVRMVTNSAVPEVARTAGGEEPPATLADTRRCAEVLGFVPRTDVLALVRRQAHHQLSRTRPPLAHPAFPAPLTQQEIA